ncbi:hypothetical protein Q5H93_08615 [Hymenobacter sp. ASUV-10]|uniref:Prokaryotic RING finger family 4 n=1 Tax=Hymenobacter aranciens TaxID=3063996 RepID=A0ABT9B966_9BACT|nr:hypothetical protein [Hymenobacter sp. ASUV-10]MDO7874790.1 hypothetical protein [Hymenobacter sp. ASUV-10]
MNASLVKVSLRQQAVYVEPTAAAPQSTLPATTALLVANLAHLGYGVSEDLLHALSATTPGFQSQLLNMFREVMGVKKNWTPLVKAWDTPTGEGALDHLLTWFASVFQTEGVRLPCGHVIPPNTFPLERYNGCPFCGTPFRLETLALKGQGSKLKVLELWTKADLDRFLRELLSSKTALDATQIDSLTLLLEELPVPVGVPIAMKETRMAVIDAYVSRNRAPKAQPFFDSPTDVLRYLWYKHTGFLQLVEPRTIRRRKQLNGLHFSPLLDRSAQAKKQARAGLKLKYTRREGRMVAEWLDALPQSPTQLCEIMHPKRGMWVRFIRALRLAEYSKKLKMSKLRETLDEFYNQTYEVWQGRVNYFRLRSEPGPTLALLQQRPGLFARSLFANMLWFGSAPVVAAFAEVVDKVPARLVLSLGMYAETYFTPGARRLVKPLGGVSKSIPTNALLALYDEAQIGTMRAEVEALCQLAMRRRFAAQPTASRSMFIDPVLFKMPLAIGDRSETVQDLPAALMGTRFAVEGGRVRLFLQWGVGLPAQHLDMDLSCQIAYAERLEICSYSNLTATGCQHSGDIQHIPNKVGTAEYIELDLDALQHAGAQYATFTCNAYTAGSLSPNLVVGWMNSANPMKISSSGVAYDPSCVQHQVRVTGGLTKGLVFGVFEVARREIVWLELPFYGQVVQQLDVQGVRLLLRRLESKLTIGQLLTAKAEAQQLALVPNEAAADEAYTAAWARNPAAVTQLLLD